MPLLASLASFSIPLSHINSKPLNGLPSEGLQPPGVEGEVTCLLCLLKGEAYNTALKTVISYHNIEICCCQAGNYAENAGSCDSY